MPLYVYECSECGLAQEHIHGVNEKVPPCGSPETILQKGPGEPCGVSALKRQLTAASLRFERSVGWDGWDKVGPNTIGRVVDSSKHITDQAPQGERQPGSQKSV